MTANLWIPVPDSKRVAAINSDGCLYRTEDFDTPASSGGPTWTRVDLNVAGEPVQFVMDPFSPYYLDTGNGVDGWIATTTKIYRVVDIFGTPSVAEQFSFRAAAGNADRAMDFSLSEKGFGCCITHYQDAGTYETHTTDGVNWSTEQVLSPQTEDGACWSHQPVCYVSSKTPGLILTTVFEDVGQAVCGYDIQSLAYRSTDYGQNWENFTVPNIDPNHYLGGNLHVPWHDNPGEKVTYITWRELSSNDCDIGDCGHTFKLMRTEVDGVTLEDITPLRSSGKTVTPRWSRWSVESSPHNRLRMLLYGYSPTVSPPWGTEAGFVSTDGGDAWQQIGDTGDDYKRGAIASDGKALFVWGTSGKIGYSSDFGATGLDDRRGNIPTDFSQAGEFIGIISEWVVGADAPEHDGAYHCPENYASEDHPTTGNPISLRKGEKRLEAIDLSLTSPAGPLTFTRTYRESKHDNANFQFMGLGWTHNHRARLWLVGSELNHQAGALLPNGGILKLKEDSDNAGHFDAHPGSNAILDYANEHYTLIAPDGSTYVFGCEYEKQGEVGVYYRLETRTWATGEAWRYRYASDKAGESASHQLVSVEDDYGRGLQFTYVDKPGEYNHEQLRRVGDQDAIGLDSSSPAGHYIELTYTPEKSGGQQVTGAKALLSSVRDVRGNSWTYDYYGQDSGETTTDLLNLLVERKSPSVDTTGDGQVDGKLVLEELDYTFSGGKIAQVTQERGGGLLTTELALDVSGPNGEQTTTEKVANQTTTHYFDRGVYAGAEDPLKNRNQQTPNSQYRSESQEDANLNQTKLAWSADGKLLNQVSDALGNATAFAYDDNDRLTTSVDAEGRETAYIYDADSRQPTMVLIGAEPLAVDIKGDMEEASGWSGYNSPLAHNRFAPQVDSGNHARYVVADAAGEGIESAAWDLKADQDYTITARVYPVSGTVKMQIPGVTPAGGDKTITESTEEWEKLTITHTPTSSAAGKHLQFVADGGAATFYVDTVSIATEGEIDVKGDMETDDPNSGWSSVGTPTTNERSTGQVDSGTYSRHVVADAADEGIESVAWNLVANQTYTIHARVYPDSSSVKMRLVDGSGEELFGTRVVSESTDAWETLECVMTPSQDVDGVQLQFLAKDGAATFYVDTVSVQLTREVADPLTGDVNGTMEEDSGWSGVNGPDTNERRVRADEGSYLRYVKANTGSGIQSDAWTLEVHRTYTITARVYLITPKKIKMTVTGGTGFDTISTSQIGEWQTLRAQHTVTGGAEVGNQNLRFLANEDGAEFYVDSVSVQLAPEIAINGGMEETDGWTPINGAAPTTNDQASAFIDSGDYARYVAADAVGEGIESAVFDLEANQTYIIRARVYPVKGTVKMQIPGVSAFDKTTEGTGAWETLTAEHTPTTAATGKTLQFVASVLDSGEAEFYVDSVSVVTNGEIDVNGDMEVDSGWSDVGTPTTNERSSTKFDEGTYSRHVVTDAADEGIESVAWNLVTNQTYTIRARVYVVDGVGNETVKMRLVDGSDVEISSTSDSSRFTDRWESLSCEYKPDSDESGVNLQFLADDGAAEFYVDTVSIELNREVSLNGDMAVDSGWTAISGAAPVTNERRVRVDSGLYYRHIEADNAEGIESNSFTLVEDHTYLLMARLHLVTNKAVKMTITGGTGFDAVSSTDTGEWQTLRAVHKAISGEAGNHKLQFLAQANGAEFYVDTVHVIDLGEISSEDINTQVHLQEFTYDTKGRTLTEISISPATAKITQQTTRSYYASGAGNGLLHKVVQKDMDGTDDIATTYYYDNAGRVIRAQQSATFGSCRSSYTVYDEAGNVLASICNYAPGTKVAPTTAEEAADLYDANSPNDNHVTTHRYDEMGRRVETTAHAGTSFAQTTLTFYDALNRVWRTIANYNPQGSSAPGDWVWDGNWEDGSGNAILFGDDKNENVIADTAYNALGLVRLRRDVLGHVTFYGYDVAGRLVKTIQNAATLGYNNDFTGTAPDPDLSGYAEDTSSPDVDIITEQAYDAAGNLVKTIDPLGNVAVTIYDALNRPIKTVRNPNNPNYDFASDPDLDYYTLSNEPDTDLVEATVYDAMGRVKETKRLVSVSGEQGEWTVTRYVYDELDRQYRTIVNYVEQGNPVVDPADWTWDDGTDQRWEYNSGTPVDYGDNDQNLVTHTEYNDDGRVLWTRDPEGNRTWHVYDGFGRQTLTVANYADNGYELPSKWVWESGVWKDDISGTEIQHGTDHDENVISQTYYDADGRVTWTRDSRGSKTHYAYDSLGRQIRVVRNFYDNGYIDTDISLWVWDSAQGQWEDTNGTEIPHGAGKDRNLISSTSYDLAGQVSATRDTSGNETRYAYDESSRQIRVVRNFYDNGYIDTDISLWVWDSAQDQWEDGSNVPVPHGSDLDRNLISETGYNVAGQVTFTRDVRGTKTEFVYDGVGRRVQVKQAANSSLETISYTCYNKAGQVLRTIANWLPAYDESQQTISPDARDANGDWVFAPGYNDGSYNDQNRIVRYEYDGAGRRVKVTDPVGNETVTAYCLDGQVDTVTDPENTVSLYRYDGLRRRNLVVQGYDNTTNDEDPEKWGWDANENPPRWEESDGTAITHGADHDRNIIVQVAYDVLGRKTSLRDPRGNLTQYEYDKLGRRIKLASPLNKEWVMVYEDVVDSGAFTGETLITLTDPKANETARKADRLGRPKSIDYNDAASTPKVTFDYDLTGNRTQMTENNGTSNQRITGFEYDQARRLTKAKFDPDADQDWDEEVSYEYDLGGQRTKLTLPGSLNIAYTYDQKGRLISLTDWDGHETQFAYDNANRLVMAKRANGLRSRYLYDAAGRLQRLRHTQGRNTLAHFAYEVDKHGSRTQALELLAHPATTDDIIYSYDDASIVYQGTWTDEASTYKKSETFSASLKLAFFGPSVSLIVGTGVNHSIFDVYINGSLWQSFDGYAATSSERTIDIELASDGPHIFEIRNRTEHSLAAQSNVGYDETKFIVRFKQLTVPDVAYDLRTIEYSYDALSRLQEARYNPGINVDAADADLLRHYEYNYDLAGNRTQKVVNDGATATTTDYEFNAANQIARSRVDQGTWTDFSYDDNGNLTDDGPNTYTWDRANRLLSMGGISYAYDGLGNRISQTANSIVTSYLLDLQPGLVKVLAATTSGNTDRFVHGPRGIHAQEDNSGTWTWPVQDGLGSVRGDISDAVAVNGVQSYAPYGDPVDGSGLSGFPFTFTGEFVDANDLVYLRARYYCPGLGVFTGLDPVEGDVAQALSLNRYGYMAGNVVNAVDPSGLSPSCQPEVTCPDATLYVPEVDYSTRLYIDDSYAQRSLGHDIFNVFFGGSDPVAVGGLSLAIELAKGAGNDDAARHLSHWLEGSGSTLEVDVNRMLNELPRWKPDIVSDILNPSVTNLVLNTEPSEPRPGCRLWTNRTTGGFNPNYPQENNPYNTWRRVGQSTPVNIYSDSGIDTSIFSGDVLDFDLNDEFKAFVSDLPNDRSYTREEFDWYLAMNAFDYSISESVIVDDQGNGQLCYQIHIADEYGWYRVSTLDQIMRTYEFQGVGTHFDIRGSSSVRCERFHIDDASRNPDGRFNFVGP